MRETIPPELFLDGFPGPIRDLAEQLRGIVRRTVPEAIERVRAGWRIVGYDIPSGRKTIYFAFVAPEPKHVHMGFAFGTVMRDPDGVLLGAGVTKKVRWLTFRPGDTIDEPMLATLVAEGLRVARMSPDERFAIGLEAESQLESAGSPGPGR